MFQEVFSFFVVPDPTTRLLQGHYQLLCIEQLRTTVQSTKHNEKAWQENYKLRQLPLNRDNILMGLLP